MIESHLRHHLEPVAQRHRQLRLSLGLIFAWVGVAAVAGILLLLQRFAGWSTPFTVGALVVLALVVAAIVWRRSRRWEPDFRQVARKIEQEHPELHALLLTAVEQQPDPKSGKLNFLQDRVIREAVAECQKNERVRTVSSHELNWARAGSLAALLVLIAALFGLRTVPTLQAHLANKALSRKVTVTPGDAKVERGSGLVVLARFAGPLPPEATLVIGKGTNGVRRIPLAKTLNDPVFGGSIPEVNSNIFYHIEFADEQTPEYKVTVFEHPRMERADAKIKYPEYTGLTEKKIEDTRRISAVEGSKLELDLRLNKPVTNATLVAKDQTRLPLKIDPNQPKASLEGLTIEDSKTYELQLVDSEGRTNKVPAQFIVEVLKNKAPEIKIAAPRGDQRVTPIQEIGFQGEVFDDFGLKGYGITYNIPGKEAKSISLGQSTGPGEKRAFNHLLPLESEAVQPDQLVSWFMWAEDVGPDGKTRRTSSDMYFAEVRPFEEIFREGQSPSGGNQSEKEQQQGSQSGKLAAAQKEIINATWKLQRRETGKSPSEPYFKDEPVVQDAQAQALEKAQAFKEMTQDPRISALAENVEKEMQKALDYLIKATNSTKPLPDALAAEQAAYQALLKLSSHEFQVAKGKNQKGQQGSGAPSQQELSQLDLKQAEDRYETQSQASAQPSEQREQLQVQNRLKELAQRQQDLNEKLKELQNALQEAKTEQEKEEIRRQLKRLREQEQEMLADVDELRQRMEKPENQSKLAEAKKQLEKTRSDIQHATEALENNEASKALTAGTRAQRELQDLRDDMRKKNSSQFSEEMRQMRNDARQLAKNQEEIGKKLEEVTDTKQKRLSDSDQQKDLGEQLAKQKPALTNLLDRMRDVSEKAETAEPLLSRQLYDTLRKTAQSNTEKSLDLSEELMKRSLASEASRFEQKARKEINDLKQGVEHAAESVLGDDTEALKLAKRELDHLAEQIERDIARSGRDGMLANNSNTNQAAGRGSRSQNKQNSQNQNGQQNSPADGQQQNQNGEQPGQDQQGQQANAQNQQGEQQGKQGQQGQQGQKGQKGQKGQQQGQQGQQPQNGQQGNQNRQGEKGQQGQGQQGDQANQNKDGDNAQAQNAQQGQQGQQEGKQGQQGQQQGQQGQQGQNQQGQQAQDAQQQGQKGQQGQGEGQGQQQGDQQNQQQNAQNQQGQQAQNGQQQGQKGQQGQQGQGQQQGQQAQNGQQQGQQPGKQGQQGQQPQQGQQNQQAQQQAQAEGQGQGKGKGQQPQQAQQRAEKPQDGGAPTRGQGSNKPSKIEFWEEGLSSRQHKDGPGNIDNVLTGEEFRNWSERLRDVEEMLDDPAMRNEVSRALDKARTMRSEFKRNGKPPQWPLVKSEVATPLAEVRNRISEELARRQSNDALVPIDRDPVPNKYSELVRRYYEKLGNNN